MKSFGKFIVEGGGYGHLSHPWDAEHFTFGDLKEIISNALSGKLEYAREKTDAVNLMVSWKNGRLIAARSKSHLKNAGDDAMDTNGVIAKFKGRPLEIAYGEAMRDMSAAFSKLTEKQRQKIFNEGKSWMSLEVMMPHNAENILKYGITELRLQDVLSYNDAGDAIAYDPLAARMVEGMLKQVNADIQSTFHIRMLNKVSLPPVDSYNKKKTYYLGEFKTIMANYGVSLKETILDAKKKHFTKKLDEIDADKELDDQTRTSIINRWALDDKTFRILTLKKIVPLPLFQKIKGMDDDMDNQYKTFVKPLELLFLKIGADVLLMMTDFMAVSKDETVQKLRMDIEDVSNMVRKSNNPDLISKLEYELERLDAVGGMSKIVPTEGITFFHKGEILKLTGTFAPLNRIIGLRFNM